MGEEHESIFKMEFSLPKDMKQAWDKVPSYQGYTGSHTKPTARCVHKLVEKIASGGKKQVLLSLGSNNEDERKVARQFMAFLKGL